MVPKSIWEACEASHPGGLLLTKKLVEAAAQRGLLHLNDKILDAGCAKGLTSYYLAESGYRCVGMDCLELLLPKQSPKGNPIFRQQNIYHLQEHKTYDAVIVECVLSTLARKRVLPLLNRCLKQKGILLISDVFTDSTNRELSEESWSKDFRYYGFEWIFRKEEKEYMKQYAIDWIWKYGEPLGKDCSMSYFTAILQKRL